MSENVSAPIETSPDLDIDQTDSRRGIITSPQPVLVTADIPYPQNPNGPTEDQESEETDE